MHVHSWCIWIAEFFFKFWSFLLIFIHWQYITVQGYDEASTWFLWSFRQTSHSIFFHQTIMHAIYAQTYRWPQHSKVKWCPSWIITMYHNYKIWMFPYNCAHITGRTLQTFSDCACMGIHLSQQCNPSESNHSLMNDCV